LKSGLIPLLQRLKGWRLGVIIVLGILAAVELIVSAMSLLLKGEVTADYLVTGMVAAVLVAPPSLALLSYLLGELAERQQESLTRGIVLAESRLKMALEVARLVVWEFDIVADSLRYDERMLPLLGIETDHAPRNLRDWLDFVHPDDREGFLHRFEAALGAGAPTFDLEYRLGRPPDGWHWVHTHGVVMRRAEAGQPELAVGTTMNIHDRKTADVELARYRLRLEDLVRQRTAQLMETEARAGHILESSADGLYGVDRDGLVTFVNPAACRMLGYRVEQVVGRSAHALFHHSRPDGTAYPVGECPSHGALREGREVRRDNEVYWHADGHAIPVMYAVHPMVRDARTIGAVTSFVDMSEQRAAAQARDRAVIAAENLARVKSEFLANMSHEIRTPLNGVLGFAQIGRHHYGDSEKARNAFEKILASGKILLGVIDEILDFSKIEAGKLSIERTKVSLRPVIAQAIDLVRDRARAKGLELRLDVAADLPVDCVGDPLRIGQVLLNLLVNAVKFTEAGSVVLSARRQGDQLVFRVADTGVGMSEEQLGQLFNPFQQADGSTTRRFGGTGLGLAICKQLLDLMAGGIRVESRPGAGSLFEVTLPYVAMDELAGDSESARVAASIPGEQPLAGIAVLVAEDDAINRAVLEDNLVEDGADVTMVGNGREAVERIRRDGGDAYDIVLMDVQMPDMDGYAATRLILELAPNLPVVGQTAHAFGEERDKCFAAGMVGHIAKPIDPEALARVVLQFAAAKRGDRPVDDSLAASPGLAL
jgi:PAS domain S-box-containing protein